MYLSRIIVYTGSLKVESVDDANDDDDNDDDGNNQWMQRGTSAREAS